MPYTLRRYQIFFRKFLNVSLSFFLCFLSFVNVLFIYLCHTFYVLLSFFYGYLSFLCVLTKCPPSHKFSDCINPFYFPPLKKLSVITCIQRIRVLYDQFCINRMYQRFTSRNERMYSAEKNSSNSSSSTHMNYYIPFQDDQTLSFKKKMHQVSLRFFILYLKNSAVLKYFCLSP